MTDTQEANLEQAILGLLEVGPKSRREIESSFGVTQTTAKKALSYLRKEGLVSTVGQRRGMKYCLPPSK